MNYQQKRFFLTGLIILFFVFFVIALFSLSFEPEHIHSRDDDQPQQESTN